MTNTEILRTIQRNARKTFREEMILMGATIKVSAIGSFLACRIDDPQGTLTAKTAETIIRYVGKAFYDAKLVKVPNPMQGRGRISEGEVANWSWVY